MEDENFTECHVYWKVYPDPSQSIYAIIPFLCIYLFLFFLGLFGNLTLIYVTCSNKALLSVQNIFILNLAASDSMMCILSLPITPITNVYKNWYFGNLLCHLIPCIQGISIFVCTFSLGAIALDRYILVVRPHSTPLSQKGAFLTTVLLWILSFVVTLPYAFNMQMMEYTEENICGYFCTEKWESAKSRRAYTLIVMLAQFVVPFAVMAFCYANIFAVLSKRAQTKIRRMVERTSALESSCAFPSHGLEQYENELNEFLDKQEKEKQKVVLQNRRTTSILVAMVVWFGITWLPHNVISLIIEYDDSQSFFRLFGRDDYDISYLLNLFTHWYFFRTIKKNVVLQFSIAMSNNVVNPVLYAWLNPTFRQLVVKTYFGGRRKSDRIINQASVYKSKIAHTNDAKNLNRRLKNGGSCREVYTKIDQSGSEEASFKLQIPSRTETPVVHLKEKEASSLETGKTISDMDELIEFSINDTLV
uniref:G_PROTEIN_RECEP_F1_2 domain-containing protein n=1 Tax=Caenorhabditis japonica TaxID=281687 RepID=A0A8R1DJK1_CAEJA